MTAKGEICLRNLIADQCGANAEAKRRLPIINTIPSTENAIGKEYSVSEQFTNLYEVCKTIATQSEIGWRVKFDNGSLTLECFEGTNRSNTVQFSTDFDSLRDGEFSDSSESFSNAVYIGGKGQNDERDIYEGEDGTPNGLDRFEAWDDQSQMTTTEEYTAEALSMLTQYGQTVNVSGNGLAKCPYIFGEEYDIGDIITIAFSGKKAVVQILSVTERWAWNQYDINFSFGKPQNNLAEQLQLMLRKIQGASNKANATESVKWYTIPTATSMPADDVTFNTIGFTGTMTANSTFTLYRDNEGTGSKSYNVYCKNLSGNYTLTLTTGVSGATNFTIKGGQNIVARILVDENGNIVSQSMTATDVIESGNNQPATSGAVANYKPATAGTADSATTAKKLNSHDFENNVCIIFRDDEKYSTTASYQTAGNEALVFATKDSITSMMFVNGEDSITNHAYNRWQSLTPALQIKNNKVAIGKLIANNITPDYQLEVNGDIKATIFKLNDQNVMAYKASTFNGFKIHDNQTNALYIEGRENTSGDSGGIAITNDGVSVFGAGDTDGVLRVVSEDNVSAGAVFKVLETGATYGNFILPSSDIGINGAIWLE